jgi:hypothetical protein
MSPKVALGICWRRSRYAFKGAAVKVLQHTQPPFGTFFMQRGV